MTCHTARDASGAVTGITCTRTPAAPVDPAAEDQRPGRIVRTPAADVHGPNAATRTPAGWTSRPLDRVDTPPACSWCDDPATRNLDTARDQACDQHYAEWFDPGTRLHGATLADLFPMPTPVITDVAPADVDPAADLAARMAPNAAQVATAAALLAPVAEDYDARRWHVVTPLALPGKTRGIWHTGQPVEHPHGAWLTRDGVPLQAADVDPFDYATARDNAVTVAAAWLAEDGRPGVTGYTVHDATGEWHVYEVDQVD